jgi:signal transduction histidine kinase
MNLIDQVGVIQLHRTPVAVVFSGQFLPDREDGQARVEASVEKTAIEYDLTDEDQLDLHLLAEKLETPDEFIDRFINETGERDRVASAAVDRQKPTIDQLFLDAVKEIERIACAQFEMHKRNRESAFRHELRRMFPSLQTNSRNVVAQRAQPVLQRLAEFCGTDYLALFISPRRYISYESNPNLLHPFVFAGIEDDLKSGLLHFNWRKGNLKSPARISGREASPDSPSSDVTPSIGVLAQKNEVQGALGNGLKGEQSSFFDDAAMLCHMYLSDAYRAVLIWGPFIHLNASDLDQESHFLEEVSELALTRVLSLVQLSDSERRTAAWEHVAGLLGHYSRRAMTPVSAGALIIGDHLRGKQTYSKEDALAACESLESASQFISQAVRAPLFSFAATTEAIYKFAPASLDAIVRDCVALYQSTAIEKTVTITLDPDLANLPDVEVDIAKMRDAIGHVLDNAIKYSHENKEVRIKGELLGSHVRLVIEDFGLGIDEDELHLIFVRGYQGKRSRKSTYEEGEGLGLFHARRIVEAHKGKIQAGCRSGARSDTSARLEGYRVWVTIELPLKQSDTKSELKEVTDGLDIVS